MSAEQTANLPPPPWGAFLLQLDNGVECAVELHCLGGFVLTTLYGVPRVTYDIDFTELIPKSYFNSFQALAGQESELAKKHKVYCQAVGVAQYPDSYEERLIDMFPGAFRNLRLRALEVHDVVLAKLARAKGVDLEDVRFLALAGRLDPAVLKERYVRELRPYLIGRIEWHDQTLQLWLEEFFPHTSM